ncbi:unnamed protein product [[Candida] boidinii]|nr:unnamed protein product [[Candida] boidinii]
MDEAEQTLEAKSELEWIKSDDCKVVYSKAVGLAIMDMSIGDYLLTRAENDNVGYLKQFLQNPDTLMVNSPEDNINADTDPTTPAQTKTHSNKIDSFEYSGKNFIDLINENFNQEQIDLNNNFIASPSKDFENLYINKDTNDKQNETEKFIASRDIDIKDYKRFEKLLHILNKVLKFQQLLKD